MGELKKSERLETTSMKNFTRCSPPDEQSRFDLDAALMGKNFMDFDKGGHWEMMGMGEV